MSDSLQGRTIAFLVANSGVEQVELTHPWQAVKDAGGTWQDVEAFTCPAEGFVLVTSRNPDDLPAFSDAAVTAFANGSIASPSAV